MEYYEQETNEILKQFGSNTETGITTTQAEELRTTYGSNELKKEEQEPWYILLARQFTGILIYILAAAAIVSGLLGEWVDTGAILVILIINGVVGFVQEYKARNSIEALKKMSEAKALVIRNGQRQEIDAIMLVPGDILILETGGKIPADARIIEEVNLETLEGALTGESTPVSKHNQAILGTAGLGDQKNMVFSGTTITAGRGKAIVVATGMKSEIGKIAHMIQETETEETPLQIELDKMGSKIGKITLGICAAIFVIIIFAFGREISVEGLKEPFLLAISLAVAAIPEGLPIVVTIALAFGTQRMVQKHALIKRLASVETLGETTVICSDKTGTLTKNEMTVVRMWHAGEIIDVEGTGYDPTGKVHGNPSKIMYEISSLCNDAELSENDGRHSVLGDPTEGCLLTLSCKAGHSHKELREKHPRVGEVPFTSERKRMTTVHHFDHTRLALTKGATDVLLEKCTGILGKDGQRGITQEDKDQILAINNEFANDALRVLGLAFRHIDERAEYGEDIENDLIFVGLVGMIDPARPEVKDAIATCHKAGIRVVMITGDHITTAQAIARELGIQGRAIEGKDIESIDLATQVGEIGIYARVNPEHKMMIVDALKRKGEIVAMTGDGVNDAPALKKADIGIAMGITGTDVAKESASMILTDDNFSSIVHAVEEGRNIYTNIKKFVNYLLSSNFAEVLVILIAILLFSENGNPVWPLTATMILFMNLVTDSLPALALGVDPGDPKVMERGPRDPKEHIISLNMITNIVLIGVLVAGATLFSFWWSLQGHPLAHAQTMALTTLVLLEIVRLAMIRKQYNTPFFANKWMLLAIGGVFLMQFAVIYLPFMQTVFKTVPLDAMEWILIVGVCAATYIVGMLIGSFVRNITKQHD